MKKSVKFLPAVIVAALLLTGDAAAIQTGLQGEAGHHVALLFDRFWWLVFLSGFLGLLLAGYWSRVDPYLFGTQVLRHDGAARLSHWSHAAGCILLLSSGLGLGFLFFPRFVQGPGGASWMMDVHFLGALLFVFGGFFWLANTIISPWRFSEHMPDKGSLKEGITHYGHIFGLTQKTVQPAKYDGSERLAFVPIILFAALLILTGFCKLSARFLDLSTGFLAGMTWLHDVSALVMLVLFVFHVLLAAVVPWSWPLLGSMLHGWVTRDFARDHHPLWYARLTGKSQEEKT